MANSPVSELVGAVNAGAVWCDAEGDGADGRAAEGGGDWGEGGEA